ncbi:chondroitinase-B domain-containing protein [Shewanella gaetbuli]
MSVKIQILTACLVCLLSLSTSAVAKVYPVSNQQQYQQVLPKLIAGDTVQLANGVWQDFEIIFSGQGREDAPISLRAETKGKVILSGQSNLSLSGQYLHVSGLVFKNGYTPSSAVIAYRVNENQLANHSRVTEVVIDNYNNPDRHDSDHWVALYGQHNRFDHNHLVGKRNKGVTVTVRLGGEANQQNHHRIDGNYFGPRPTLGSNGGETIRIGTSHHSMSESFTVVENNFFDRCDGEVEIISVKAGANRIVNNTFFESRGTLTLRHGNGNVVENNVFLGNGVDHTGGIRVINRSQLITNNYLEGLTGYRFGSGFTMMNGVPNSAINRYHQVVNANVHHNSFINVEHIDLAAGSDKERSAVPIDSRISDNLFFNQNNQAPFSVFDDISGIRFSNNIANSLENNVISQGINTANIKLERAANGLLYPLDEQQAKFGVSKNLTPVQKADTGVSWYPKTEPEVAFDSGINHTLASVDSLYHAIKLAQNGDVIVLADGDYAIDKTLMINKTLTIKALNEKAAKLTFSKSALFEIQNGGNLKLDGLHISGEQSPDSVGNSVVRTSKWGMLTNYRFRLTNSDISQLNINHSFHFFDSSNHAFANQIHISHNRFSNISGDIFRLDKETEDLGIYNAEYLTINHNQFEQIDGAVVKLYRGGTDESTFGPHLAFNHNQLKNVGIGQRNKASASVYLHGVQVAELSHNHMIDSAKVVIEHTTGEPISKITHNQFINSGEPTVTELYAKGKPTAYMADNHISTGVDNH